MPTWRIKCSRSKDLNVSILKLTSKYQELIKEWVYFAKLHNQEYSATSEGGRHGDNAYITLKIWGIRGSV